MAVPLRAAAPASPVVLNAGDNAACLIGTAERYQHLIQDHLAQDGERGRRAGDRQTSSPDGNCVRSFRATRCALANEWPPTPCLSTDDGQSRFSSIVATVRHSIPISEVQVSS